MARVVLVRHGEAAASFVDAVDPGLSPVGRRQALALATELGEPGGAELRSSPLRRARETASPVERAWGRSAAIESRIAEIPWSGDDLRQRGTFLREAMSGRWSDLDAEYRDWRDAVVAAVLEPAVDAVFFTHLLAINVVIGRARGDDRVLIEPVANCSRTVVETDGEALRLVETGAVIG